MNQAVQRDLFRSVISLTLLGGLVALSIWFLRPFLPALVWATMITVATWPLLLRVQRVVGNRRVLAVIAMTGALLLAFVIPLSLVVGAVVSHEAEISGWAKAAASSAEGPPPAWLRSVPLAGDRLVSAWNHYVADGELRKHLAPHTTALITWIVQQIGDLGAIALQVFLTVAIAALIYAKGEAARAGIFAFAQRVSPEHGESSARLAGQAVRGVALGVVVTALAQSILGGIGLAVAGVPLAAILTAVMFFLAVAQIGAAPVLACATIWLFAHDSNGWGIALAVWTVLVGVLDNVLRPFLIRRGADLPLLLIFAGVVGGLIAFGLVGLFIGPTVLAVTWKLLAAWVEGGTSARVAAAPAPSDGGARQ